MPETGYISYSGGRLAALAAGCVQFHANVDFRVVDGYLFALLPRVRVPYVFNPTQPGPLAAILKLVPQIGRKRAVAA